MGLLDVWRWAKRVVVEQDVGAEVPIALERAEAGYAFRVGLRAGFGGQHAARIPIAHEPNPSPHPILKDIHSCEVAGRELTAANPHALMAKARAQLEQIAPGGSLPLVWFRAPATDYELPVYEDGGDIVCPILGGRRLKARTLAAMRSEVCRHLVNAGYVSDPEEVEVGVLQPRDLRRVPPATVLRSLSDERVWLPTVEGTSDDGPVVGVLDHSFRLGVQRSRRGAGPQREDVVVAPDVVSLLRAVRAETGVEDLYATEVTLAAWATAAANTRPAGVRLVCHLDDDERTRLELEVRRTGAHDLAVAVEDRGITAFLAPDEETLRGLVVARLERSGFLRSHHDVEIASAAAPRAEHLEPEAIRTNEEAHA